MNNCKKEYDCERLLLDIGLSTRKSRQLSSSLKFAIKKQDDEMKAKECNCNEVIEVKTEKPTKKKDVNEVINLRRKDKEEK